MNEELARADAFRIRQMERLSTTTVPFAGGIAYLDEEFPQRYDSNLLWVHETGAAPVERWIALADDILGGRGLRHRKIVFGDPADSERMSMGFLEHGYAIDRGVLMELREDPDRDRAPVQAEEVTFAQVRPLIETTNRRQPWATNEASVRQLTDYEGKLERAIGARFFMARVDGEPAGCCELYVDGVEAQIEAVDTLEEYRGRGLASGFVLAAAAAAREAGAMWTFLWADADDWPRHWYRTLGFREVASAGDLMKWPPEDAAAMAAAKSPGTA